MDKQVKSIIVICFMILVFVVSLIYCNLIEGKEDGVIEDDEPIVTIETSYPVVSDPYLNGTINGIVYNVKKSTNYNSKHNVKGYYVNSTGDELEPTHVIVAAGEKSTGGYSIKVTKVDIDEDHNVTIIVEEESPSNDMVTIQVLTYPVVDVYFGPGVNDIKVVDNMGNLYDRLD